MAKKTRGLIYEQQFVEEFKRLGYTVEQSLRQDKIFLNDVIVSHPDFLPTPEAVQITLQRDDYRKMLRFLKQRRGPSIYAETTAKVAPTIAARRVLIAALLVQARNRSKGKHKRVRVFGLRLSQPQDLKPFFRLHGRVKFLQAEMDLDTTHDRRMNGRIVSVNDMYCRIRSYDGGRPFIAFRGQLTADMTKHMKRESSSLKNSTVNFLPTQEMTYGARVAHAVLPGFLPGFIEPKRRSKPKPNPNPNLPSLEELLLEEEKE